MLSFKEFIEANDIVFSLKSEKQRRKEMRRATHKARVQRDLQKKINGYKIGQIDDPATLENMEYICESLDLDTETTKKAIEINQHLLTTSEYQNTLKQHFKEKLQNKGKIDGDCFRMVAKMYARMLPTPEGISPSMEALVSASKEQELVERIATDALENTNLSNLWNGISWVGDKIKDFFRSIWNGLKAVRDWAIHHPSAAAIIVMISLSIMCWVNQNCASVVQHTWSCIYDFTLQTAQWVWNFMKSFVGINTDFIWSANEKAFLAKYAATRTKQMYGACDEAMKAARDASIAAAGTAGATGNIPLATAATGGAVASVVVGYLGCWGMSVATVATVQGASYLTGVQLDYGFEAMRTEALANERTFIASEDMYKIMFEFITSVITATGLFAGYKLSDYYKAVDKIAKGARAVVSIKAKAQVEAAKDLDKTIGLDKLKL